ncbi:TfoX/Sxy family protein [Pararhizobium sp. A13]|uniref:TfoX/Sxy family protein n=1 Tax=Pararhizobium sp. A13 TaxID=3133975 RepID=UPI003247A7C7
MSIAAALDLAREVAERIQGIGPVSVSRFFGGAALKADGVQFGFVVKGSLYLRVDSEGRPVFETMGALPFQYSSSSKTVTVARYYEAPAEIMDDPDTLSLWASRAHAAAFAQKRGTAEHGYRRRSVRDSHEAIKIA